MPEQPEPTPAELARQLRQHLDSLRAAGIHWLPATGTPAESASSPEATAQPALFAAANEPTPSSGIEQRRQELTVLAERVSTCQRCTELVVSRSRTVFGIGPLDAELCFVGEAPGATEDQRGEPFVGEAGQLLDRIIAACGMKREEVYICNIVKCLHGYTKVLTEHGWQQIQHLVSKRYPGRVAAVDDLGRLLWAPITEYHRSPRAGRRLVKLCLRSARQGSRPACGVFTEDHEVLTQNGFKPIHQLDPKSDKVHSGTFRPSHDVHQAVLGVLLGDGRIARSTNTFSCAHGERQLDYLYHKAKILGIPENRITFYIVRNKKKARSYGAARFNIKASPYFRWLGQLFYREGRKEVPSEVLPDFGVISLAYLFMDDGYLRIRPRRSALAEIAVCSFDRREIELLLGRIRALGIEGYLRGSPRRYRIHFDVVNTAALSRLIAPYVIESMNYKLLAEHQTIPKNVLDGEVIPFYDSFEVLSAPDRYDRLTRTVYCLSVDGYENFITHAGVVHNCRPPGNRLPTTSEAGNCREYLERQIELVRPKFLCALGACAAQNLLGTTLGIGKLRGRFHDFKGIPVMCTYHPAFLLPGRSPHMKKEVWGDMKKLLERMGRPIPQR